MSVLELRQYTLKPGRRDDLIALFEQEFIESQEALGMTILGTFRDAGDPNRFIWLRGFADMESRATALAAFYGGPVWKANREAANDTMIDSDNVLLLAPAWKGAEFRKSGPRVAPGDARGLVIAQIHYFDAPLTASFVGLFRTMMPGRIEASGGSLAGAFMRENAPNNFPALPVREGEEVFVSFTCFSDAASAEALPLPPALSGTVAATETLRLIPTARSSLHG